MLKKSLMYILLLCMLLSCTACVTIVKTGEEGNLTGEIEFDADDDVAAIWESQAIPALNEEAVDLVDFIEEAKGDFTSLAENYGRYSMGDSGSISYVVKGTVTVKEVVSDKSAGYMVVVPEGYDGEVIVKIQIGSVFKGTAVRDSLDFIKYENYANQVDYAAVSQSIHQVIQKTVIDSLNLQALINKQIEFTGCFSVDTNNEILITPVQITTK